MHTLLIDPTNETRDAVTAALHARGHDVSVFEGVTALRKGYSGVSPTLVVAAGLEVCQALFARDGVFVPMERATVLAVVAHDRQHELPAVVDLGVDDYLLTPLDPDRLHARLALVERRVREKLARLEATAEQARAQAALRESESRARRLAGVASRTINGVIITDTNRRIEWVNEGFTRITGYTLDEARGETPGYFLHGPETAPETVDDMQQRLQSREGFTVELRNHRKVGTPYWVRVEVQPLLDSDGQLTGFMAIETDITDERRAEEALRESEAKARAILETTVDAIITIDPHGNIESFNAAAERIFGYRADEVIGSNIKALMPDPYQEEHDGYLRSYRETGHRRIIGIGREVVGRRKDGSTFPMDLAVSEVTLGSRRIFTGIVRDISERWRLEQEILEISEEERRRIGQDLHDGLGQMLTGTTLIAQSCARRLQAEGHPSAGEVAEIAALVKEADLQARGLAQGLVPVELDGGGLASALRRLSGQAERLFGIDCVFEEHGHPWSTEATSATHFYRIAQEAVSNAVKHGQARRVGIVLASGGDKLRLRVRDDGIGFPETLPETRGMGVRIMRHRARMMGGTVEIRRDPAGGSVVTCTVPRSHLERGARPEAGSAPTLDHP